MRRTDTTPFAEREHHDPGERVAFMFRENQRGVVRHKQIVGEVVVSGGMHAEFVARSGGLHDGVELRHIRARTFKIAHIVFQALADFAARALIHAGEDGLIVRGDVDQHRVRRLNGLVSGAKAELGKVRRRLACGEDARFAA